MSDRKPSRQNAARRTAHEARPPRLDRDIQALIGFKLRAMYGEVVEQGVPDRFVALLRQFDGEEEEYGKPKTEK